MKIKYYFPLVLLLTGCSLFKGQAYDFAYKAIDELSKHVEISTVEIKNALYHPYEEDDELNELVVLYYFYDELVIEDLDAYAMYSYNKEEDTYKFTIGDKAEMYFYFATGMDNENYDSLKVKRLNNYIEKELI